MNDIAIRAIDLRKKYHIGKLQNRSGKFKYKMLRDTLTNVFTAPFYRLRNLFCSQAANDTKSDEILWAVNGVSFEIKQGEVVGIIGRNGAGKSTLLKILSRITEPTKGFAEIHGRVGSLLEVGTGFHPELTGRENIYLNGAILGMKRAVIVKKFDEIVDFAEIEKFIDTPVKHYSSGMYLRLAFAVAAHLEPEILLVDEVLAVGDARFQRKCMNKMDSVGQEGRTVLFVSHNMPAITRICKRTILLGEGRILHDGPSHEVVSTYLNSGMGTKAAREWSDSAKAPGGEIARLFAVKVQTEDGLTTDCVSIAKPVGIEMEYEVLKSGYILLPHYHFFNEEGVNIFQAHDTDPAWRRQSRPAGRYKSTAWIPGHLLSEGTVFVSAGVTTINPVILQFFERDLVAFQVVENPDEDSARGEWAGKMGGLVRPLLQWTTQFCPK